MKSLRLILIALTLTLTSAQDDWDRNCGSRCDCKWFSGKKMAECSGQKLTHVPSDLSSEIQILDLTDNIIPHLSNRAFSHANLVNLHKIVLRDCAIETVDAEVFDGLGIVIEVDLSGNKIAKIAPGTFVPTQRLRILRLDDNDLEFLEDDLFKDLLYLQKVVLSRNRLVRIGERAFSNLPGLQTLALNGNNLTTLNLGTFNYLPKLSSLDLQENPWNCDCHLKSFHGWTLERRLYTRPTMCDQPSNLKGRMWDDLASADFDCRPKIKVSPGVNLDQPGSDVTLWCRTTGLPRPHLAWIRGSMVLKNSTKRGQGHSYVITETSEWLNLTIPNVSADDGGDYACVARSSGGSVEKIVGLTFASDLEGGAMALSFPLALGLGTTSLVTLILVVGVLVWCRRKGRNVDQDKGSPDGSPERHGLGERGNSSVAAVNPGKLATPHGSLGSVLNGTLAGSESVFVDGPRVPARTDEESGFGTDDPVEGVIGAPLERGPSRRHLPPDLLAFRNGSVSPITHGYHPAPLQSPGNRSEPFGGQIVDSGFSAGFRTLPHNRSFGPMTSQYNSGLGVMLRHGYVTIPRRPRPPSWGNGSGTGQDLNGKKDGSDGQEPLYDNLGQRTTADGSSVLSLNKSPEPGMRGRPLPRTPTGKLGYNAVQRSNPNILTSSPLDRSAPEGAPGWPTRLPDEISQRIMGNVDCRTLGRKLPPRPPPKPENRTPPGPLFEDEGEDGTEV